MDREYITYGKFSAGTILGNMENITIFESRSSTISISSNIELRKNSAFVVHCAVLLLGVAREDFGFFCLQELPLWNHDGIWHIEESIVLKIIIPKFY